MDDAAFDRFAERHDARYAGFLHWLGADAERRPLWRRILDPFALDDAVAASDTLAVRPRQPETWESHLDALAHLCRERLRLRFADETRPRRCELCDGSGLVEVYPLRAGEFWCGRGTDGKERGAPLGPQDTFCVRCRCTAGLRYERTHREYDPRLVVRWAERAAAERLSPAELEGLLARCGRDPNRLFGKPE